MNDPKEEKPKSNLGVRHSSDKVYHKDELEEQMQTVVIHPEEKDHDMGSDSPDVPEEKDSRFMDASKPWKPMGRK